MSLFSFFSHLALNALGICCVLHDLVPFAKFKKREKHPWRSVRTLYPHLTLRLRWKKMLLIKKKRVFHYVNFKNGWRNYFVQVYVLLAAYQLFGKYTTISSSKPKLFLVAVKVMFLHVKLTISVVKNIQKQPLEVFCKKRTVLRNFAKFTGTHLFQSLFLNKVAGLRLQLY